MGIHSDAVGCVQLINIAAVCTKIVIDDTQQVMGRLVQIVPAAGELLDAAVQHRGDVQLFRQMRPARFQPEHLFILLLDGDQEHQDHRNADGQIDQRQAIVHDLDRDREQRQHRCRDLHPVDSASLLRPIFFVIQKYRLDTAQNRLPYNSSTLFTISRLIRSPPFV